MRNYSVIDDFVKKRKWASDGVFKTANDRKMGYYNPPSKTPQTKCKEALQDFLTTKKKSDLMKAYNYIVQTGDNLISALLDTEVRDLIKEFADYEIEYKANIALAPPSKLFSKVQSLTKGSLEEIHSTIDFDPDKVPYLKDTKEPVITKGKNHFYSLKDEEFFVLTHKKGKWSTKIKEPASSYNFGLKGEEFIIKRKESKEVTNLSDLLNMVLDVTKTQEIVPEGFMEKTKADQFLLNIKSGRIYNLTIGLCKAKDREDLLQLEIEYSNYIPLDCFDKKRKTNSEKQIIEEILEIQDYIIKNYDKCEVQDFNFTLNIEPTTLTKFEWITGKKTSSSEAKVKETKLVEEQTLFDDTLQ